MTEIKSNGSASTNKEQQPDSVTSKALKGLLLWGIILFGYLLFSFNWMLIDTGKGSPGASGWYGSFFGSGYEVPAIVDQAPNYTLTFMRGVGSFLCGWVLVKIGHKYSVGIALGLLGLGGVAAPLMGLMASPAPGTANYGAFSLFLIMRMVMSVGATTLIVYTQPIIANYFNDGQKKFTNLLNATALNIGTILGISLLVLNLNVGQFVIEHWIAISSGASLIAIVLMVIWLLVAEPIESSSANANDDTTYGSVLKEKRTWLFAIMFAFWLTWTVGYISMAGGYFMSPIATDQGHLLSGRIQGFAKIMFLAGLFAGIPMFNYLMNIEMSRKTLTIASIAIGVVLTLIGMLIGAYFVDSTSYGALAGPFQSDTMFWLIMFYLVTFASGMFCWGLCGVFLGTTFYYKGATPKKQGILMGVIWGVGYMGETINQLFLSIVMDLTNGNPWLFFFLFIAFLSVIAIMWVFIPETHGKNACEDSVLYKG